MKFKREKQADQRIKLHYYSLNSFCLYYYRSLRESLLITNYI